MQLCQAKALCTVLATSTLLLGACASNPTTQPGAPITQGPASPQPPQPTQSDFALTPVAFQHIPGWSSADLQPALSAFQRHCNVILQRPADRAIGGRYTGTVGDWQPHCRLAHTIQPGQERWFFENHFTPSKVGGNGEARLTAYFEPTIEARRSPQAPFIEPLLSRPSDMITVDLHAFAEARDDDTLRGAPRALTGQVTGNRVRPYPKRENITPTPEDVIAYAHPADVYNLQVQGSGRLAFPDGSQTRAAFAAQNGHKWHSALGALRASGAVATASWPTFRNWMDNNPGRESQALNADPSYVFFQEESITNPTEGPKGAAGIPLTALGSIAVDPAYHPYGSIVFVDGTYNNAPFQRLFVAQDTGGAIRRGPERGDVFFGSGAQAGQNAEQMNAPASWWTLLPRPMSQGPIAHTSTDDQNS